MNDLRLDAVLPDRVRPQGSHFRDVPQDILVTGATGFLGSYLLAELLARTEATLHCVVRGESHEEAKRRLVNALSTKDLWSEAWATRLIVHRGDLEAEALGLDAETVAYLATTVDAIYHCGARVNFAVPYSDVKVANVAGTMALIELACSGRPKVLHHISTLGVFDQIGFFNRRRIEEQTIPELLSEPITGYAASKWVAEQLVMSARNRGLVATIHRPGTIAGATDTGAWNRTDLVPRAIKGCIQIGAVPELAVSISLTPVDFVARTIVAVARSGPPYQTAYHPIADDPVAFSDMFKWLRLAGYRLDSLPYEAWQSRLRDALQGGQRNALAALSRLLLTPLSEAHDLTLPELFMGGRRPRYANDIVATVVGREAISAATIDQRIFLGYAKRWLAEGWLPTPQ